MTMIALVADLLKRERMPHTLVAHPPAYTAQEVAQVSHTPGNRWAKVVVCIADRGPVQAVLPAHYRVDFARLQTLAGAATIRLAVEQELESLYPGCELGAIPPFGQVYGHALFVDQCLVGEPELTFSAGTHTSALCMHYWDFAELAQPVVGLFAVAPLRGQGPARTRRQRVCKRAAQI